MVCRNCARQSPDGTPYCPHCGTRIAPYSEEETKTYVASLRADVADTPSEASKRDPGKRKNKGLIPAASILGSILLLVILSTLATPSTPTPSPAPTSTAVPTLTSEDSSEAHSTPEKPNPTPSERAYARSVEAQTGTVGKAFTELGELFENPLVGKDQWTIRLASQITVIRIAYNEAMELDPPSSMAEIHLKYTQAMEYFNDATYLIAQGVDELDSSLIDAAAGKLLTGNRLINDATQLLSEFSEAHELK